MDATTASWLAFNRLEGLSPGRKCALLTLFNGDVPAIFAAARDGTLPGRLSPFVERSLRHPDCEGVEKDLAWLAGPERYLLKFGESTYPPLLAEIPDPPLLLFVWGEPNALLSAQLAVVGSRASTRTGAQTARTIAQDLASKRVTITSGLARGIDSAAHRGALAAKGCTVGVAAHGLDSEYPRASRGLFTEVREAGALVSEFGIGVPPRPRHFPQRNRIVSGLSLGTLVVEASPRSGSLITARLAMDQGRDVFAVPGSVGSAVSKGCNALLKDGATLVVEARDILEELPPWAWTEPPPAAVQQAGNPRAGAVESSEQALPAQSQRVLSCVDACPAHIETIVDCTGLTTDVVSSILLALEIGGLVGSEPGLRYFRTTEG